jgi:hypothetical protein
MTIYEKALQFVQETHHLVANAMDSNGWQHGWFRGYVEADTADIFIECRITPTLETIYQIGPCFAADGVYREVRTVTSPTAAADLLTSAVKFFQDWSV